MTIGWQEVAASVRADMVGGTLIYFDPATNSHVDLGSKDDRGQFTFSPAGQLLAEQMTADAAAAPTPPPTPLPEPEPEPEAAPVPVEPEPEPVVEAPVASVVQPAQTLDDLLGH